MIALPLLLPYSRLLPQLYPTLEFSGEHVQQIPCGSFQVYGLRHCGFAAFFFFEQASQLARSWKETGLLAGKCQLAALLFETLIRLGYLSERYR